MYCDNLDSLAINKIRQKAGRNVKNNKIYQNNLDAEKFQLLASKDRTGMTVRFQSTVRTEFGTDYELRLSELYQTVRLPRGYGTIDHSISSIK